MHAHTLIFDVGIDKCSMYACVCVCVCVCVCDVCVCAYVCVQWHAMVNIDDCYL